MGQLLCATMEELQLEMGVAESVLGYSCDNHEPTAARSLIVTTWRFLLGFKFPCH
jgi:hypothetical protein